MVDAAVSASPALAATTPAGVPPPRDAEELTVRAEALEGVPIDALAARLGLLAETGLHAKGKVGVLIERALGATGGSRAEHDFPALGIELKTVPVDEDGAPSESTYVCAVSLLDADRAEWATSWVKAKLAHVLWVPVVTRATGERVVGRARSWSPTAEQDDVLQGDFDEIMGRIGMGGIEMLSARVGRWLQLRPKAATGSVRTTAPGVDGDDVRTVPRGFYLRSRFTGAILSDPSAMPA